MIDRRIALTRGGITLLDTLATMGVLLMIAVAAAGMLGSITEIGLQNAEAKQTRRSTLRFAEQFRADIESTNALQLIDSATGIQIDRDAIQVQYRWDRDTHAILRTERRDSDVAAVEQFRLSETCQPEFQVQQDLVTVVVRSGDVAWVVEAFRG